MPPLPPFSRSSSMVPWHDDCATSADFSPRYTSWHSGHFLYSNLLWVRIRPPFAHPDVRCLLWMRPYRDKAVALVPVCKMREWQKGGSSNLFPCASLLKANRKGLSWQCAWWPHSDLEQWQFVLWNHFITTVFIC